MWKKQLEIHGYKTLYFNAWVNDFDSSPLVAILAELKTIVSDKADSTFKSLLSKGAVITKKVLPGLIKAIAEKYVGHKVLQEIIGDFAESAVDILSDEVNEYAKKKKGLLEFRNALEVFIKENTEGKPLVFLVDELDRCRPNYAVEVLEQVKHFFNVSGIVFVLTIDKTQLGNAIRGFYGSDRIDANEYLRRFIDIEYSIPLIDTQLFCRYLYDYFGFDDFFNSSDRKKFPDLRNDKENFIEMAEHIFKKHNTPLRQQEKIFGHARLVLNLFGHNSYVFSSTLFLLIFIRDFERNFYQRIVNKDINLQETVEKLNNFFPDKIDEYDLNYFIYQEAQFLQFYDNYYSERQRRGSNLFEKKDQNEDTLLIRSGFVNEDSNIRLLNALKDFRRTDRYSFSLEILLKKIDLLEPLKKTTI